LFHAETTGRFESVLTVDDYEDSLLIGIGSDRDGAREATLLDVLHDVGLHLGSHLVWVVVVGVDLVDVQELDLSEEVVAGWVCRHVTHG